MTTATPTATPGAKPVFDKPKPRHEQLLIGAFTVLPMLALIAAVPLAWGWGLSWLDIGLAAGFYLVSVLGVTAGFHRSSPTARSRPTGAYATNAAELAVPSACQVRLGVLFCW